MTDEEEQDNTEDGMKGYGTGAVRPY